MKKSVIAAIVSGVVFAATASHAEQKYGPGVSDTEIKIGNTMVYSGPVSAFGVIGKAAAEYFDDINRRGGINGRKIAFLSRDDAFSPPKTVEQTRRLVEDDQVLFMCCSVGTAPQLAVQKYLQGRKVPQLFVGSAVKQFSDAAAHPWSMSLPPNYGGEGRIFAKYIMTNVPEAKIGIFYQDDDSSKDYMRGLKDGLGARAGALIVKEASYEIGDASIDSQIISLQASGASVLINLATPKFAAMAIREVHDIGWKPVHILISAGATISGTLKPAGLDKSLGIISAVYLKDPADPAWKDDPGVADYVAFVKRHLSNLDPADFSIRLGYTMAQATIRVLQQARDDLTRENIMRQAAHLHEVKLPLLLPGIALNTSPTNYADIRQLQLERFDGTMWVRFGGVISE